MYINPKLTEINDLRSKAVSYQTVLDQSKELKNTLDSVLVSYNSITDEEKAKLSKLVPQKFNSTAFINDVNGMALRDGIILKSVKADEPTADANGNTNPDGSQQASGPYNIVKVSFSFQGQYSQFIKMLKDIEASLQLMDITAISIKPTKTVGGTLTYDYSLELNTYYLK